MVTIKSEQIRPFDVDGCLVIHGEKSGPMVYVPDVLGGPDIPLGINIAMVRLLKEEHARGGYIIVWSRGGYDWARAVVEALGLTREVSLVMSKPLVYFDDSECKDWMTDRVFIAPDTPYKY